mgnify:CR=1 FL=1
MLTLGVSGGALEALMAALVAVLTPLEPSWGVPGRSWAPLGGRFGTSQGLHLNDLDVVCGAT